MSGKVSRVMTGSCRGNSSWGTLADFLASSAFFNASRRRLIQALHRRAGGLAGLGRAMKSSLGTMLR
jgi:hypothetical protein